MRGKHTANLLRDLSWIITETMAKLPMQFANQSQTFELYRTTEISDKQAHDLIIRFYDEHAVNLTDIPSVLREWREPRHPEFIAAGKTGWRLFNAVTETIKGDLWRLPARTRVVHNVLDEECGLKSDQNGATQEIEITAYQSTYSQFSQRSNHLLYPVIYPNE